MKKYKNNKSKGVLTLEFALLIPILLSVFLAIIGIIYTVNIQSNIDRSVMRALEDISDEIYIYSKLNKDSDINGKINKLVSPLNKVLGKDIILSKAINKEFIRYRLKRKTMDYISSSGNNPFWLKDDIDFEISYSSNSLIVRSNAKVNLPVINSLIGNIKLSQNHIQAARGVGDIFNNITNGNSDDDENKVTITISKYSYSGNNKDPVYHDKNCMGVKASNPKTNIYVEVNKDDIENGKISYHGKKYRYCKYCQKLE